MGLKRVGPYSIITKLGVGFSSKVYLAINNDSGQQVAIKCINRYKHNNNGNADESRRSLLNEVEIMKKIDHPNILKIYDIILNEEEETFSDNNNNKSNDNDNDRVNRNKYNNQFKDINVDDSQSEIFVVMQYADGGSLATRIEENTLSCNDIQKIFKEITGALDHLHNTLGIVHRDIKPENVLLNSHGEAFLCDFGMSKCFSPPNNQIDQNCHENSQFSVYKRSELLKTRCGSPHFSSPELIKSEGYTEKTDVWSLGVLLYTMVTGKFPFDDDNIQLLFRKIILDEPQYPPDVLSNRILKGLIDGMLMKDWQKRFSILDVLRHPYNQHMASAPAMVGCSKAQTLGGSGRSVMLSAVNNHFQSNTNNLQYIRKRTALMKIPTQNGAGLLVNTEGGRMAQRHIVPPGKSFLGYKKSGQFAAVRQITQQQPNQQQQQQQIQQQQQQNQQISNMIQKRQLLKPPNSAFII